MPNQEKLIYNVNLDLNVTISHLSKCKTMHMQNSVTVITKNYLSDRKLEISPQLPKQYI